MVKFNQLKKPNILNIVKLNYHSLALNNHKCSDEDNAISDALFHMNNPDSIDVNPNRSHQELLQNITDGNYRRPQALSLCFCHSPAQDVGAK